MRFERGDSTLKNETSINTDLSLRVQTRNLTAEVGAFANYINNFIFPDPSGEIDPASGFQIFDITQGDARLTGFEAAVEYHATTWLHLRGTADAAARLGKARCRRPSRGRRRSAAKPRTAC